MEKILSVLKTIYNFVAGLSIEHITLLSVLVTLIIFVSDKRKDIKTAQLEARREEYKKFIQLLEKFSTGKVKIDGNSRKEFFDAGVSLLLYGSKKVYKKYIFFRDYTTNPVIQNSKHNKSEVLLYVVADILKAIRHEVGLTYTDTGIKSSCVCYRNSNLTFCNEYYIISITRRAQYGY